MTLAARLRARGLDRRVRERADAYREVHDPAGTEALQLALLNTEWQRILEASPYFADLARELSLPENFSTPGEFRDRVPVTTRALVGRSGARMRCTLPRPDFVRTTGGSTSEPVQIPSWRTELRWTEPDTWLGRSWYGIGSADRLFLLWGHAHLLGSGWGRHVRGTVRRIKDSLLGYERFPAYDMRPEALRTAAEALLVARPDYFLGYSVALDLLARANVDRREALRALRLKAVIATAESFPRPESADLLTDLFGCPVAMEYGAVETGVLAHSHPDGGFRFFWRSYLVEAIPAPRGRALVVTSLYPRSFPLVRYEIGDAVELGSDSGGRDWGLDRCERILGRCNDYVVLSDGTMLHSEAFSHVFKPFAEIRGFQVLQAGSRITVRVAADAELTRATVEEIRARMASLHADLAGVDLERRDALEQTVAGKTRMVIRTAGDPA